MQLTALLWAQFGRIVDVVCYLLSYKLFNLSASTLLFFSFLIFPFIIVCLLHIPLSFLPPSLYSYIPYFCMLPLLSFKVFNLCTSIRSFFSSLIFLLPIFCFLHTPLSLQPPSLNLYMPYFLYVISPLLQSYLCTSILLFFLFFPFLIFCFLYTSFSFQPPSLYSYMPYFSMSSLLLQC